MALFPQGLTHIDPRCANAGERAVLRQLKRCLEDDYIVWHDVPLGPKARQPDFVILSPRWGVLLLEVKHWKRATLRRASRDSVTLATERGPVTEGNPLRQARDYALELVDLMAADPALVHADGPCRGRLLFPYGWGVVFSNLRADELAGSDAAAARPDPLAPVPRGAPTDAAHAGPRRPGRDRGATRAAGPAAGDGPAAGADRAHARRRAPG